MKAMFAMAPLRRLTAQVSVRRLAAQASVRRLVAQASVRRLVAQASVRRFVVAALLACSPAMADDARPVNPHSGNKDVAKEGGSLFNQYCSHCHGPWAEQAERPRDLRRLRIRYGDDAIAMFYTTVNNGRMEKGMPVWKGVLKDDTLWRIFTFLETVQEEE